MKQILIAVLPVFAFIAAGYLAARLKLVPARAAALLGRAVFDFALPVVVFSTMATAPPPPAGPWALWGAYFTGAAISWVSGVAVVRLALRHEAALASAAGLGSAYGNLMLLALSLTYRLYGEEGALPLLIILSIHLPLMILVATIQMEWAAADRDKEDGNGGREGLAALVGRIVVNAVSSPIIIGLLAGVAYRHTGIGFAPALASVLKLFAMVAVPGALFSTGLSLQAYGFAGQIRTAATITACKLVLHPLAVWLLATYVFALPPLWVAVATLAAAAPTGVNTYLFAHRYKVGVGAVSTAIAGSTALSVVTISAVVWLLHL